MRFSEERDPQYAERELDTRNAHAKRTRDRQSYLVAGYLLISRRI
jgi:hypothetical protein